MFCIKVYYNDEYEFCFFVKDLLAASLVMTSITNDALAPSFEVYPIKKEEI